MLESFADLMATSPPYLLLLFLLASPLCVLVHEAGHAVVAAWRIGGPIELEAGNAGPSWRGRAGSVDMRLRPLQLALRPDGLVRFDANRASAADVLLVAIAGPLASAIGAVVTAAAAAMIAPGFVDDLLRAATVAGVLAAAVNVVPMRVSDRRGAPAHPSDGYLALEAARLIAGGAGGRQAANPPAPTSTSSSTAPAGIEARLSVRPDER